MKVGRQSKIIELITDHDIETQEELADKLNKAGYNVTQATISRDIRELKLTKIATSECIAGDDTIFCAIKSVDSVPAVMDKITKLVNSRSNE